MNRLYFRISFSFLFLFLTLHVSAQNIKELKLWLSKDAGSRGEFADQPFARAVLSRKEAVEAIRLLTEDCNKQSRLALDSGWKNKEFRQGNHIMKFEYKIFGKKPANGRSLFISMHGGGDGPASMNDQQWQNQIRLYTPAEGVYLAPRAPTNTWNMWHQSHIDTLFDKIIRSAVLFEGVSPDKVYLMGYSAGGDGVYQLAPRMADRWAAAAMMAGHPNDASPLGLRNIGFTIHAGALDSAYHRNEVAAEWGHMLDSLQEQDRGGYKHFVKVHEGRAHWMYREDTVAVSWMAAFRRNPLPDKIVWEQDDVHHLNFYWLSVPAGSVKTGGEVVVSCKSNKLDITKNYSDTLIVHLNDAMMNLDRRVKVNYLGKTIFDGKIKRKMSLIYETLQERKDEGLIFTSEIVIVSGKVINQNIL